MESNANKSRKDKILSKDYEKIKIQNNNIYCRCGRNDIRVSSFKINLI